LAGTQGGAYQNVNITSLLGGKTGKVRKRRDLKTRSVFLGEKSKESPYNHRGGKVSKRIVVGEDGTPWVEPKSQRKWKRGNTSRGRGEKESIPSLIESILGGKGWKER